ncbi:MAG TPA: DUF29 domain-containing protein [Oculatellaceae cyanobacterium]|jgi:hypothetical protein
MTTNLKLTHQQNLYDIDFYLWIVTTAQLLRDHKFDELDLDNLIEEIEDMGKDKRRELKSRLVVLLMHLLKYQYQPERRSSSWRGTILEQRRQIESLLKDSPSLKPYYLEVFADVYKNAVVDASAETLLPAQTFPVESPFLPEDVINSNFIVSLVTQEEV